MPPPRKLDAQETKIARALIRNPRLSDNRLGEDNDIPVRTVSRKRARLEKEALLRYYAEVDMSERGTGHFQCRHLYIIRFRLGVTVKHILDEVRAEPRAATVFTRTIYDSSVAEMDGRVALLMTVDGRSDADIVERFQEEIVPSLRKNHGKDSIEDISTVRVLAPVRLLRNYLPEVNMGKATMHEGWSLESIFVA